MIEIQRFRASDHPKTAHTSGSDALAFLQSRHLSFAIPVQSARYVRRQATIAAPGSALAAAVIAGFDLPLTLAPLVAAFLSALGLAALHGLFVGRRPRLREIAIDFLLVAAIAASRDDGASIWQSPAALGDLLHLTPSGVCVVSLLYFTAAITIEVRWRRHIVFGEALLVLLAPLLFNLLLALNSSALMREFGSGISFNAFSTSVNIGIGRIATLFVLIEASVCSLGLIIAGRWARNPRLHGLLGTVAIAAAITPVLADVPQMSFALGSAIGFPLAIAAAAAAQSGLWSITYLLTGIGMDALNGGPPTFSTALFHARNGALKGAVYGGVFIFLVVGAGLVLRAPNVMEFIQTQTVLAGALGGAVLFPLIATLVASADGTAPFFGRLRESYRTPRSYLRGLAAGLGVALAASHGLVHATGLTRFLALFLIGAVAYGGINFIADGVMITAGRRKGFEVWQSYLLGIGLGGIIAGALGWYFDSPQIDAVTAKFWAYVDQSYLSAHRPVTPYMVYPWFSKWGALDLGQVAGGVRLFYDESLSGVINWSIAAPLFGVNFVVLDAIFKRSLAPLKRMMTVVGFIGVIEQTVRVLRWGLWMAPVINSFLRQSPDPAWYNQDGAVRSVAASAASIAQPSQGFRDWSLSIFTGLLAYDWLRVLIWFDHMGLRVATLVNLTFIGGDRADEAAARFVGYSARARFIPEGIRRFATWMPLLIPFYIPRGADWDKAWSGAERLRAAGLALPLPVLELSGAYLAAAGVAIVTGVVIARHWGGGNAAASSVLSRVPPAVTAQESPFRLSNGCMRLTLQSDGRGHTLIEGLARSAQSVDLTRRLTDPLQLRGPFFYLREPARDAIWSVAFEPAQVASRNYSASQPKPNLIQLSNHTHELDTVVDVSLAGDAPIAIWRIRLTDRSGASRHLKLTSYRELALHEPGSYVRDPDFNAMHVQTWFLRPSNAIFARNRLLHDRATGRPSQEVFFHAAIPRSGDAFISGYEDSRTRFIGSGTVRSPEGLGLGALRSVEDEGSLYTFDPAACLALDVHLDPNGTCELVFIEGHAPNETAAAEIIAGYFKLRCPRKDDLAASLAKARDINWPPAPAKDQVAATWPFAFAADAARLHLTPKTPRPWTHLIANDLGQGVVVSNEGEIHSFAGNERQNALTPFNLESVAASIPSQLIYVVDHATGDADTAGYVPFRRTDAHYEVTYGLGTAQLRCLRENVHLELTIFIPPDEPADIRLLKVHNPTDAPKVYSIVPYFEIVLAESSEESRGKIEALRDPRSGALLFTYPANDFRHGWAFAATSLPDASAEIVRSRFIGEKGRDLTCPVMVETGHSDPSRADDGCRVAAFAGRIEVPARGSVEVAVVLGQEASKDKARKAVTRLANVESAKAALHATNSYWAERFATIQIETNQPDFDRLVNHWLPYQVLTSRLWGRTGPNQRGGAFGFRDQLQDVLPFVFLAPALVRRQILLHAGQQFPEGDVFKWWHQAPDGNTGIGQRTRASDPHLWLPYVTSRYIAATGDLSILDEEVAFLDGPEIPEGVIDLVFAARRSRQKGSVYDHCRRAIDYALGRMGAHGLPLIGTGDWNDSIDLAGIRGKGESVWLGFFLYDVLTGFEGHIRARGSDQLAKTYSARAAALKNALDGVRLGNRYPLAFDDNGSPFDVVSAMIGAWPILSGASDFERGRQALDESLRHLEKQDHILLISPPFDENSEPFPGRVIDYPPGVRENGGQYSHGVSWVVDAYMRLSSEAKRNNESELAEKLAARAFACWVKISPIGKTDGEKLAVYGLAPHQQAADIYDGPGYAGRGGWSWYTGAAARMLSAAYAILGLDMRDGEIIVPDDLFEPKGTLTVRSIRIKGKTFDAPAI